MNDPRPCRARPGHRGALAERAEGSRPRKPNHRRDVGRGFDRHRIQLHPTSMIGNLHRGHNDISWVTAIH